MPHDTMPFVQMHMNAIQELVPDCNVTLLIRNPTTGEKVMATRDDLEEVKKCITEAQLKKAA